jgi:hypothetical protein
VISDREVRDAIYAAMIRAANDNPVPEGVLKLANAFALMQPDEEEEDSSIYSVGGTAMLSIDAEEGCWEGRAPIGFTPR